MTYKLLPRFFYSFPFYSYFPRPKSRLVYNEPFPEKHTFFYNSARVALRVLLNSISDSILTIGIQAYTCQSVFQAIKKAGHNIVFIDLTNDLKLDLVDLQNKITRIDVLIITHTFGFPENIEEIFKIAKGKIIIEDCAHSFLSQYNSKYTGLFGDASFFSTGLGKFPPIGNGGFSIINKPDVFPNFKKEYDKLPNNNILLSFKDLCKLFLFSYILKPPIYGLFTFKIGKKLDSHTDFLNKFSFNQRKGHKWLKPLLLQNFTLCNSLRDIHKQNANYLVTKLKIKLTINYLKNGNCPNFYAFPILINNRDNLINELLDVNIEAGKHFFKCIEWAKEFGYKMGDCPNTEKIINNIIVIPIHSLVSKKHIITIANKINESYSV
ncbi:MAG TPA: DegT/DnrJ/EryC1/StrS family aminotransferase [Bacteroidales bacterium]|nr:DegT/DnrJ/EryC1/StrS family aminotransferase [Bacteroidales bacterium]